MKKIFKNIQNYIICFLFPKQVLKKVLSIVELSEVSKKQEDEIELPEKINKALNLTLDHLNHVFIYTVMEFFAKELNNPLTKLNIKKPSDLLSYCRGNLIECYTDGEKQQKNYFIETARFRFMYNYNNKDFSIEYIIVESGKDY